MANVQSTYTRRSPEAYAGMIAELEGRKTVVSLASEGETPFGSGVFRGTDAVNQGKVSGTLFRGVAIRNHAVSEGEEGKYGDGRTLAVMLEGPIWVELETISAIGDALTVDKTTGKFGNNAVAGNYVAVNAIIETPTTAVNQLALIRLSLNA